jgi:DNA (cytosine-5)-methyltransferase 1
VKQSKKRKNGVPTFIDLFAGVGGIRLAFEQAGARCAFSSEWDSYACKTYTENFGETPRGDITKIKANEIPDHDILTAGFPCQPFSIAGVTKHNALGNAHGFRHATQGTLFFDVARIIESKRPRAFMLENVKNLLRHDGGKTFAVIRRTLEFDLGYTISWKVIDAQAVVPQHRERVFIVGFRDPVNFEFPDLGPRRTRLADILEPEVDPKYTLTAHLWTYLKGYAAKHRAKGNGFGYGIVDLEGVSRTLSARYYKDGSEILIPQAMRPRRLTPRECARLMGFPDSYKIVCSDTRAYQQFGNSVVVPVVEQVAKAILQCLKSRPKRASGPRQPRLLEKSAAY